MPTYRVWPADQSQSEAVPYYAVSRQDAAFCWAMDYVKEPAETRTVLVQRENEEPMEYIVGVVLTPEYYAHRKVR